MLNVTHRYGIVGFNVPLDTLLVTHIMPVLVLVSVVVLFALFVANKIW